MKTRRTGAIALAAVAGMLGACTTMVEFKSNPPGASVSYLGQTIGTTPFTYGVSDQFGWWSVYTFTASRDGYETQSISYPEPTPLHAQLVVPSEVQFEMKSRTAAAPAPVTVAAAPAVAPAPAPQPAAAPAAPVAVDPAPAVEVAVKAWADAWSRRDMPAYVAAYTTDFTGSRASRKAWEADRRARIATRKHIQVDLAALQISVTGDRAVARFRQTYASDVVRSVDDKQLELARDASGRWLIRSEVANRAS